MNYRHLYHAGSFADVFKHVVLLLLVEALVVKPKPFSYVDTHAGLGKYNLKTKEASKTKEFLGGISQILTTTEQVPEIIQRYRDIVNNVNKGKHLKYYPGSPRIVKSLLRPDDRMILTELHCTDVTTLKDEFKDDKQVAVHHLDGYQGIKAFLPPQPRRGLVLIDPPYESPQEFNHITKAVFAGLKHWREGVYAIWYPVKNRYQINNFERKLRNSPISQLLMTELNIYPDDSPFGLNGSGLAIINPPWQLDKKLLKIVPWLLKVLDKERRGNYRIDLYSPQL